MFCYKFYFAYSIILYASMKPGNCQREVDIGYYRRADFQNATKIDRDIILAGENQEELEDECLVRCKESSSNFAAVKEVGRERISCVCGSLSSEAKLYRMGSGEGREKLLKIHCYKILNISVSDKQLVPSYYHATPFDKIYKESLLAITDEPWQEEEKECNNADTENMTHKLAPIENNNLEFCRNDDTDKNHENVYEPNYDAIFPADSQNASAQCALQCTLDSILSNNLHYHYYTLTDYLDRNLVLCKCFTYKPTLIMNLIMCNTCSNDQSQNCSIDSPTSIKCIVGTRINNVSTSTISDNNSNDDQSNKNDNNATSGSHNILYYTLAFSVVVIVAIIAGYCLCCKRRLHEQVSQNGATSEEDKL